MPWLKHFLSHLNKLAIIFVELERCHLFGNANYLHSNCCKNIEWQMITFIWNYPCSETIKLHLFFMRLDPIFSSKQLVQLFYCIKKWKIKTLDCLQGHTYKDKQGYIKSSFPQYKWWIAFKGQLNWRCSECSCSGPHICNSPPQDLTLLNPFIF